jgi:hypothetical protein
MVTTVCSSLLNKGGSRGIINHISSVFKISGHVVTTNEGLRQQYSPWSVLPPPSAQYKNIS